MKPFTHGLALILITLAYFTGSCRTPEPATEKAVRLSETLILDTGWYFSLPDSLEWMPATVPGCVHTDLLNNSLIRDPFYGMNEKELQWIDKKEWIYRCEFEVSREQVFRNGSLLRFRGLDTYTTVELNGAVILHTDNMFRTWTVSVKPYLVPGKNILTIRFHSPIAKGFEKLEAQGYGLPAVNDQSEVGGVGNNKLSVFTRKAPYHFGWDWGPRFVTSGIWRPVELLLVDHAVIDHAFFQVSNLNSGEANIDAIFDIRAAKEGDYMVSVSESGKQDPFASISLFLERGSNSVTIPFTIIEPELWWPNGMGEQHLYDMQVQLEYRDTIVDRFSGSMGVRTIELVRTPDSSGTSFYFSVNGRPVFAKGANYIPNDNFLNRVTAEKYENIIRSAAESHMNMLRVWGGGIYENDIFYDLCDRYGILVWQDFMFACSMYPGDTAFLRNVREEALDNIRRLQNHPSIALWCGNNEIDAAWCEGNMNCGWGWKQRYTPEQRQAIWHSYDTLFHHILPEIVKLNDPKRDYWPSSPQADWGEHAGYHTLDKGDMHYWGVWHGNEPFSSYYELVGRFMSEYGFQSLPDKYTVGKFTVAEDRDFESEVLLYHQRSGYGNSRIIDYMKKLYPVPDDFDQLLYIGQVMQAEAIKSAILAHRAAKPHCMGSLYWQLNDCWPGASWSSIDYYGSWKALQYFAKKACAPVSISFVPKDNSTAVFINTDLAEKKDVAVKYSISDFEGIVLQTGTEEAVLDPQRGTQVFSFSERKLKKEYDLAAVFLNVEIFEENNLLAKDHYFFKAPKDLKLPEARMESDSEVIDGDLFITIRSDVLIKNLYLDPGSGDKQFSDNYFDILPGEEITVSLPGVSKETDLNTLTLNKILHPESEQ